MEKVTPELADKARQEVADILNAVAAGERLLADILVGSDAAIFHLLSTHAQPIGYSTPQEAFQPRPPRLVGYPLPEFSGGTEPEFYFDADETINRLSPLGVSPSLLYGLVAVQIYDLWECHLRCTLASALGLEKNDVRSDFFGELNRIRQHLAHAAPITITSRNNILRWGETGSLRVHIPQAREFRKLLVAELDELTLRPFGGRMASALLATTANFFALERQAV